MAVITVDGSFPLAHDHLTGPCDNSTGTALDPRSRAAVAGASACTPPPSAGPTLALGRRGQGAWREGKGSDPPGGPGLGLGAAPDGVTPSPRPAVPQPLPHEGGRPGVGRFRAKERSARQ